MGRVSALARRGSALRRAIRSALVEPVSSTISTGQSCAAGPNRAMARSRLMRQSSALGALEGEVGAFMARIVAISLLTRLLRQAFVTMAALSLTEPNQAILNYDTPPGLDVAAGSQGTIVRLSGQWTALALARDRARSGTVLRLRGLASQAIQYWDLSLVERIDHVGAQALWRVWGRRFPAEVTLTGTQRAIFERVAQLDQTGTAAEPVPRINPFTQLGLGIFSLLEHLYGGIAMFGRFVLDLLSIVRHPKNHPLDRDFRQRL